MSKKLVHIPAQTLVTEDWSLFCGTHMQFSVNDLERELGATVENAPDVANGDKVLVIDTSGEYGAAKYRATFIGACRGGKFAIVECDGEPPSGRFRMCKWSEINPDERSETDE